MKKKQLSSLICVSFSHFQWLFET